MTTHRTVAAQRVTPTAMTSRTMDCQLPEPTPPRSAGRRVSVDAIGGVAPGRITVWRFPQNG
jgi:hypothetical protein